MDVDLSPEDYRALLASTQIAEQRADGEKHRAENQHEYPGNAE
jgi:hypothetical protein